MPGSTGGRTPAAPPRTDSGVCAISPSDLVGYTGNLINRVNELEQRIAELEASNVEVNQLSDLSQQVGWVGGITYLGTPGWTQTEYGTLIPPAGVSLSTLGITMSDGNSYQMVSVGEDGELIFGFTATGAIGGSGAMGNDYMTLNTMSGTPGGALTLGTVSASRGSAITLTNPTTITLSSKGIYAYNLIIKGASADVNDTETFHADQDFGWPFSFHTGEWSGVVDEDSVFYANGTNIGFVTTAPCTLQIEWQSTAGDPSASITQGSFQIVKLAGLT